MTTITFASSKGGAGKTTSAIILAVTLAQRNRVCVIDADPAQRLKAWALKAPLPSELQVLSCTSEREIHDTISKAEREHQYVILDLEGAATRLNAFAMGESDLVIIPMGDEHPDAEGAIETLAQVKLESRAMRREIPVRILFARTQAAVKSRLAKSLNAQVREKVGAFSIELHNRTAYSSLHNYGGTLHDLDRGEVSGVEKAMANADLFAEEVRELLNWVGGLPGHEPQMFKTGC